MLHQILHQRPQLPPHDPAHVVAVRGEDADGAAGVDVVGSGPQAGDVGAVVGFFGLRPAQRTTDQRGHTLNSALIDGTDLEVSMASNPFLTLFMTNLNHQDQWPVWSRRIDINAFKL